MIIPSLIQKFVLISNTISIEHINRQHKEYLHEVLSNF